MLVVVIETLTTTTEIGAERPIHKCGNPMSKHGVLRGRQRWRCGRRSCNEVLRRYEQSEKGREANRAKSLKYRRFPDYRRKQSIYKLWYRNNKKREKYG